MFYYHEPIHDGIILTFSRPKRRNHEKAEKVFDRNNMLFRKCEKKEKRGRIKKKV